MELLTRMLQLSSEGYIAIGRDGTVQLCNPRAREIFGFHTGSLAAHPEGQLLPGDFVILADNSLGTDDGQLSAKDFRGRTGDPVPQDREGLIYMGMWNQGDGRLIAGSGRLEINGRHAGKQLRALIDPIRRRIEIAVDEAVYPIRYLYSFGHLVVLDPSGNIKFLQDHGYTARGESAREILEGNPFGAKTPGQELPVVGRPIDTLLSGAIAGKLKAIAHGAGEEEYHTIHTVNGKPLVCDLVRLEEGALLRFEEISDYGTTLGDREAALRELRIPAGTEPFRVIDFQGQSTAIRHVRQMAYRASRGHSNVVLSGESGTGKSLLARQIHDHGTVYRRTFVEVNCSAIPENLFESEFFGYERGAFTGAQQQGKPGYFEMAHEGTLFLDEIAELSPAGQSKLLNVIQSKRFYRVGGTREVTVDFRLITATNRDLATEVAEGRFREDLYYRLNVFPIHIPPLRDRREDIPLLITQLLPEIRKKTGREAFRLSSEAIVRLSAQPWPGNVRELENMLERLANLLDQERVEEGDLTDLKPSDSNDFNLKTRVVELEKELIEKALELAGGDKKKALEWLGIRKSALYEKMKRYGIE